MMQIHLHFKRHVLYYVSLLSILIVGLILIKFFSPYRSLQLAIVILISSFYGIIGIIHHKIDHTLTIKVMLEYVLIASVGIAVMLMYLK